MRTVITTLLLIATTATVYAQKTELYCKIIVVNRVLSNKVTVQVDFGEEVRPYVSFLQKSLQDSLGNTVVFNTDIDAMNYMARSGWKVMFGHQVPNNGGPSVYHYFLRKEFDTEELKTASTQ